MQELINIDIPPPPDEKAALYLMVIEHEIEIIRYKINSFLKNTNDYNSIELFALKNIQVLKGLSEDLRIYIKKLDGDHGNVFFKDPDHYILYVLKCYIILIIQHLQKTFSPFIHSEIESEDKLRHDLFREYFPGIPMFSIFPLLPKEKEYEDFKKKFIAANKVELKNNKLTRQGLSLGAALFDHYRSKNLSLNRYDQIFYYRKQIHFWNELLITNKLKIFIFDEYRNEPEIEEILIPLINNEIIALELELKHQKKIEIEDLDDLITESPRNEYKSLTRARAYCIMQMYLKEKISETEFKSKNKILKIVKREFPEQSGQTLYTMLRSGKDSIYLQNSKSSDNTRKNVDIHPEDYKYGLKLFKLKYPDS